MLRFILVPSVEQNSPPVGDKDFLFSLLQSISHILHVRLPVHIPGMILMEKSHQLVSVWTRKRTKVKENQIKHCY